MSDDLPDKPAALPDAYDDIDPTILSSLKESGDRSFNERLLNLKLEGVPFSPFMVYGLAFGIVAFWLLGACVLSLLGPIAALLLMLATMGAVFYTSQQQVLRETRIGHGMCPKCGFDLRGSVQRCPECGQPIPEEILRRRRADRAREVLMRNVESGKVVVQQPVDKSPIPLEGPDDEA